MPFLFKWQMVGLFKEIKVMVSGHCLFDVLFYFMRQHPM